MKQQINQCIMKLVSKQGSEQARKQAGKASKASKLQVKQAVCESRIEIKQSKRQLVLKTDIQTVAIVETRRWH